VSETVLDRVAGCLRAALDAFDPNVRVPPVALLWTDEGAQWVQILPRIAELLPVVSLGEYEPQARRGPAYWLRCVVARTIDAGLPEGPVIVYLSGVSRSELRAADTCPPKLAPIAELQYRSQWFSHPNNRDWTVRALLTNRERGLGLRIADDPDTNSALLLALDRLLDEPVDRLAKQVIDEELLLGLVNEDEVGSLLRWLDDPQGFRAHADPARWTAFIQQCKAKFGFDPGSDGEITAARKLGARQGQWANAWRRFAETPDRYPGIADQLRRARPDKLIVDNVDAWPQDNEQGEDQLRSRLRDFAVLTPEGARKETASLEKDHGWRRGTVWADLDRAPLALALEHLVRLAEVTAKPLDDEENLASLVDDYAAWGWRADDAVIQALASVRGAADRDAVSAACAALYRQWLDDGARALQKAIGPMANAHTYVPGPPASTTPGAITVFVDGLRLDVARRLEERLTGVGLDVVTTTSFAALPTVTETAKAALVPARANSLGAGPDLHSANAVTGTKASIQVLRALMEENGVQVVEATDIGDPRGTAWTETGEIDHRGHDVGVRLVEFLDEEVHRLATRIRELLDAGWTQVNVVTDHGWVFLPRGMEKVELPVATTEFMKGRCARLKDGAAVNVPTVPWFWDPDVRIALAPGAMCFKANKEYEHGGVSPQECIVPRLAVRAAQTLGAGAPEFTKVKWLGLQCRVEFIGVIEKVTVDLRGLPAEPTSSIAEQTKETSTAGKVSLFVRDEEHEGERAHLVIISPDGRILAQREVVVGKNR
jgi:hypothetical protein